MMHTPGNPCPPHCLTPSPRGPQVRAAARAGASRFRPPLKPAAIGLALLLSGLAGARADTAPTATPAALAPVAIELPRPAFTGTPPDFQAAEHREAYPEKPRPAFLAPVGVKNVARGKPVTCSDARPYYGTPSLVTDGDKEANDDSYLEMHRRAQYVQIDLQAQHQIHAVVVWHAHQTPQVYRGVVVQIADDPDFTRNVRILFNNDFENASGLGVGNDKEYWETLEGKLIPVQGLRARYLRAYSRGSTYSEMNRCTEIEVYALPATQS